MKANERLLLTPLLLGVTLLLALGVAWRLVQGDSTGGADHAAQPSHPGTASVAPVSGVLAPKIALPVEGARVRRDTFVIWVEAEGRAAPVRSAPLQAEVAGTVLSVRVQEGSRVTRGEILAQIDPSEYELAVRRAQAEVDYAHAEFEGLTVGDDRLLDAELRARRARLARLRSGLPAAEVALAEASYQLERTKIRAPFAGRVADVVVAEGARLHSGDAVAAVIDLSTVDVEVQVLERALPAVEVGSVANVRFAALPERLFDGYVVTVNPVVSRETGTARVTVRLRNPESDVLPGMYAEVEIAGRRFADRLFVPWDAIVARDKRDAVFRFHADEPGSDVGLAKWIYIRTGLENAAFVEVSPERDGDRLEPGSIVLVEGHATLTHEAPVRLENLEELVDR